MSSEHKETELAKTALRNVIDNLSTVEQMLIEEKPCAEVVNRINGALAALLECRSIVASDHLSSCGPLPTEQADTLSKTTLQFLRRVTNATTGSHH